MRYRTTLFSICFLGCFILSISSQGQSFAYYFLKGMDFYEGEKYDSAVIQFTKAIDIDPGNEMAYLKRALARVKYDKNADIMDDLLKAIELKPDFAEPYYSLGAIAGEKGSNDEAISNYTLAIKYKPGYSDAYNNRGIIYKNRKQYKEALADFNKALETDRFDPLPWCSMGLLYWAQGKDSSNMSEKLFTMALNCVNESIHLDSTFAAAYSNKGAILCSMNNYPEALKNYIKAIELDPDFQDAYYNIGIVYYNEGKKEEACTYLRKAAGLGFQLAANAVIDLCK